MKKQKREIFFGKKEKNNLRRRRDFLELSPAERFQHYLKSFDSVLFKKYISPESPGENKENFCIYKVNIQFKGFDK